MALFKRKETWWISVYHNGKRVRKSAGTQDKIAAQQYHDKLKADLWKLDKLEVKPERTWEEAVLRWISESKHKRSLDDDKKNFRWLDSYFRNCNLSEISRDFIENVASKKEQTGVKPATVNRMLALIRAIMRKAEREWGWIDKAPYVRMRKEEKGRIRWLTRTEADRLLKELPEHLSDMAKFSLCTGLRESNVRLLKWQDVDLIKRHAIIHPDQAKANRAIPVPLNNEAVSVLRRQIGKHHEYVFVYDNKPVCQCNTRAWRYALKRAGIENFRWHDLRHTWASWHVQNGTSLQELQQLGGWNSFEMVLRYAHLSSNHLKEAANRLVTNSTHGSLR